MSTLPRRTLMTSLLGVLGLAATACTSAEGGHRSSPDGAPGTTASPVTVENCDAEVTFAAPPQRVVLLDSAPVTTLDGLGVLDRVVARAGSFPPGYFADELAARLEQIPALSEEIDATGHLQISQEVVIAQRPDLVLGLPDGVTREGLAAAGAAALLPRTYCGDLGERARFEALYAEIEDYGRVFDRAEQAASLVASLQERVAAVPPAAPGLTAAVLYASRGGGPLYAYGATSMATAQLDALGIRSALEGTTERVFEVSAEPLLAAAPDLLIVLHEGDVPGHEVVASFADTAGLRALPAVRDGAVLPLLFNFAEPASPLVVEGLERIAAWLAERGAAG
ncbi:ABC transporter substrate-binding protein [Brachybacterium saurashtrense]|uniref:ABC transporter substrate-binding protein n=1 Tax=Brachybacterium saurashtrense TaxID=556288 RepID=A0A345YSU9_9MICO|nr:ABC transporter substrate-binding protein [Brachybacterium saurashtrense]AXK47001.1 ABC transporter substrate-binding protein [Brachybacterium saurashtrense]RRR22716.1 ABC transporter substrate-binding protein [Brachybacterium saurashtrense]